LPNISVTIADTSQAVSRPVIMDIVEQVRQITKISKDAKVFFPGDSAKMATSGTTIGDDPERQAIFNSQRIVFIEVEEEFNQEAVGTTAVTREEHMPVFLDNNLGVRVCPVYATTDVTINFKYRCPSKAEALRWHSDIRMRVSQMCDMNLHSVTYHYLLPQVILNILDDIHQKRETIEGYGQNIVEYIKGCSTERLTLLADTVGNKARLAIAETQTRIQGLYGFEGVPEKPERDDNTGTWTVTFSYKFSYEKPIACNMKYPIMVHSQLLSPEYIEFTDKAPNVEKVTKSFSKSFHAFHAFEMTTLMDRGHDPDAIIHIPSYDDFTTRQVPNGTGTVMWVLCEIDVNDRQTLFNLNDLGDYIVDKDILDYIRTVEYPYVTKPFKSLFQFTLHKNENACSGSHLECLPDLTIRSTVPLDPRINHRIRFSIATDLSMVDMAAMQRLKMSPVAFVKTIASMNEMIARHPKFQKLSDQPEIFPYQFDEIYWLLTGTSPMGSPQPGLSGRPVDSHLPPRYQGVSRGIRSIGPHTRFEPMLFEGFDMQAFRRSMNTAGKRVTVMTNSIIAMRN
jgi:hypothetical protein